MSVSFKKLDGLYYAKDLDEKPGYEPVYVDENGIDITDTKFAIGPSNSRSTPSTTP